MDYCILAEQILFSFLKEHSGYVTEEECKRCWIKPKRHKEQPV